MTIARLLLQAASDNNPNAFNLSEATTTVPFYYMEDKLTETTPSAYSASEDIEMAAFRFTGIGQKLFVLTTAGMLHSFTVNSLTNMQFTYDNVSLDVSAHPDIANSDRTALDFKFTSGGKGIAVLWQDWDGAGTDYNKLVFYSMTTSNTLSTASDDGSYQHATYTKVAKAFDYVSGTFNSITDKYSYNLAFFNTDGTDTIYSLTGNTAQLGFNPTSSDPPSLGSSRSYTGFNDILDMHLTNSGQGIQFLYKDTFNGLSRTQVSYSTIATAYDFSSTFSLVDLWGPNISGADNSSVLEYGMWNSIGDGVTATDDSTFIQPTGYEIGRNLCCFELSGSTVYYGITDNPAIFSVPVTTSNDPTKVNISDFRSATNYCMLNGLGTTSYDYSVGDIHVSHDGSYLFWTTHNVLTVTSNVNKYLHKAELTANGKLRYSLENLTGGGTGTIDSGVITSTNLTNVLTSNNQIYFTDPVTAFTYSPDLRNSFFLETAESGGVLSIASYINNSSFIPSVGTGEFEYDMGTGTGYAYAVSACATPDGTKLFVLAYDADTGTAGRRHRIWTFTTTTPWDASDFSYTDADYVYPLTGGDGSAGVLKYIRAQGIAFNSTGTKFLISGHWKNKNVILEYALSTPYELDGLSANTTAFTEHNITATTNGYPSGIAFSSNGKHLFAGNVGSASIIRYDME